MAIYSLNHRWVGRSTHQARTAGAHVRYITRPDAATHVMGARMPTDRHAARSWMDAQEQADRKNARVCDKVMIALPRELTHDQRVALVEDFAEAMTKGRASWIAAIHDRAGVDDDNPHAHVIFRDRDFETRKRVMQLSEMGGTDRLRETWQEYANMHLELAGSDARIDRRSLKAQGIDREAGIHVGNTSAVLEEKGERPESQYREVMRHVHGEHKAIIVDYPELDRGQTRAEANAAVLVRNQERDAWGEHDRALPRRRLKPEPVDDADRPEPDTRAARIIARAVEAPDPAEVREYLAGSPANNEGAPPPREDRTDKHSDDMEREDERALPSGGADRGSSPDRAVDALGGGVLKIAEKIGDLFFDFAGSGEKRPMSDEKQPQQQTSGQAWAKAVEQSKAANAQREENAIQKMQAEKGRGLNGGEEQRARSPEGQRER